MKAKLVTKDDGLPILLQRGRIVPIKWVYRHGEVAKTHCFDPIFKEPYTLEADIRITRMAKSKDSHLEMAGP
jgi:hypothetical protein